MLSVDIRVARGTFVLEVQLEVARGEIVAIMGANGSGKSTLLEAIAGTITAEGQIDVDGRTLTDNRTSVPPARRGVGLLTQDTLLFPHLTVLDNVGFGPRTTTGRRESRARALAELDAVGLSDVADRRPRELSGGQQRRVAIGRVLATDPRILLLDEPMAAIDSANVTRVRELIMQTQDARGTLLVTHDAADAIALADRVILLDAGRIVREGAPRDVLSTLSAGVSVGATVGGDGGVVLPAGIRLEPGQKLTVTLGSNHGDTDAATDLG